MRRYFWASACRSQNVIWGNTFCDAPTTQGTNVCPTATPTAPGTYAGVAEAENGDLIYNNIFKVDNPAPLMPWSLTLEEGPVYYSDTWNVPEQASNHVVHTVNGFPLSGNVLNTSANHPYALQGGNFWWNYGNTLNAFTNSTYYNQFRYTDGATTIFPPPYTLDDEDGLVATGDNSPIAGFNTTFKETGLPSGIEWWVNVTLPGQVPAFPLENTTGAGTLGSASILWLSDGTYAFSVATNDKSLAANYTPSVTVAGLKQIVTITFSAVDYSVTFTESGLPAGDTWYVNISGGPSLSALGSQSSVSTTLPNGTYHFTVATNDKRYSASYTSPFTVSGGPVSVSVTFTAVTYSVTFTESGLLAGDTWYVNITGGPSLSGPAGTSLSTSLVNGTYSFSVATNDKRYAPSYTSPFTVNGGPVSVSVTFTLVTYTVTFTETGLVSGTSWSVTVNAVTHSSVTSTITFQEANGSYSYTAAVNTNMGSASGSFVVNGAPASVTVPFHKVTFTVSGLPSGTSWSVTTNAMTQSASAPTSIVFYDGPGSYSYTVGRSPATTRCSTERTRW